MCVCAEEIERTDKRKEYKNVPICVHKLVCDTNSSHIYLFIQWYPKQANQDLSCLHISK